MACLWIGNQYGIFAEQLTALKNRPCKGVQRPESIAPASDSDDLGLAKLNGNGRRWNG